MRITVNGKATEVSLKRSIEPKLWDVARNRAKGNSQNSKDLNDYLSSVQGQLFVHQQEIQEEGKFLTPKLLSNAFLGIGEKQWSLVELYQEHNDNMKKLIGIEYAPLTLQRYKAGLKHIKIFCKMQYNLNDITLKEVDSKFVSKFDFYLKTTAKCQHNSAMKHMRALKKIILSAIGNDYIRKDPFHNLKITQKETKREILTDADLIKLKEKEFSIERIEVVRDLFLFQCYCIFCSL